VLCSTLAFSAPPLRRLTVAVAVLETRSRRVLCKSSLDILSLVLLCSGEEELPCPSSKLP